MSGVDLDGRHIRKGAVDVIREQVGGDFPAEVRDAVSRISTSGGTPLVVSDTSRVLGVIHLKDNVKGGLKDRFLRFRAAGIKTVMITGDNSLTAAAIAEGAGVDDFIAAPAEPMELVVRVVNMVRYRRELQPATRFVASRLGPWTCCLHFLA